MQMVRPHLHPPDPSLHFNKTSRTNVHSSLPTPGLEGFICKGDTIENSQKLQGRRDTSQVLKVLR